MVHILREIPELTDSSHSIILTMSVLYKDPCYFKAEVTFLFYSLPKYNEQIDFLFMNSGTYE